MGVMTFHAEPFRIIRPHIVTKHPMLFQSGAHRVQEPEEPPAIRGAVIGRWRRCRGILVRRGNRRDPSAPSRSIKENRPHLSCFLRHPQITTNCHEKHIVGAGLPRPLQRLSAPPVPILSERPRVSISGCFLRLYSRFIAR